MRFVLLCLTLSLYVRPVEAQSGAVRFANLVPGLLDQPVFVDRAFGTGPGSVGAVVQLYLIQGMMLSPIATPIPYLGTTEPASRYFDGGAVSIPGTTVGGNVTLRVRTWNGSSFASATSKGESWDFVITNLGTPQQPSIRTGFRTFSIAPEPGTLGLTILGLAFGIALRRGKSS